MRGKSAVRNNIFVICHQKVGWALPTVVASRVKYLDGKQPIVTIVEAITEVEKNQQQEVIVIDVDEPEDFDGELSYD